MSKRTIEEIAASAYDSYTQNQSEPKLKLPISHDDLVTILSGPEMFGSMPSHRLTSIEKDGSNFVFKFVHKGL